MQVSGIGQPLEDITGQLIMSFPHGAEGQVTTQSVPSEPVRPKKHNIYYNTLRCVQFETTQIGRNTQTES